jgi:hypothetical protein
MALDDSLSPANESLDLKSLSIGLALRPCKKARRHRLPVIPYAMTPPFQKCRFRRIDSRGWRAAGLNYPAASCGVSEFADKTSSSGVTPECFYRGSSLNFAWIPAKGMRE